jgi:RPA family protein
MGEVDIVKEDKYDKWAVESAYRTIKDAEEHKNDEKMMKLVKAEAVKQEKLAKEANAAIRLEQKVGEKLADIGKKMAEDK